MQYQQLLATVKFKDAT